MQSLIYTGRLMSRVLWNTLSNSNSTSTCIDAHSVTCKEPHILSAVCGFPKDFHSSIKNGKFGDDAWFTAKWNHGDVLGVADGVGGWRQYGIDPGEFSTFLMKTCERLVSSGKFTAKEPAKLISSSYYEVFETKQQISGSSTACVVILNRENSMVYTANIGDSGFVIVRHGVIVHRSEEQQHYFNAPYQLSSPPPQYSGSILSDNPQSAETTNFKVEDGDVILLATDGVFDNVPDNMLLGELIRVQGERDRTKIQKVANTIAFMARRLAFDQTFASPFAKAAKKNGIDLVGGKPDDITVLLATIAVS